MKTLSVEQILYHARKGDLEPIIEGEHSRFRGIDKIEALKLCQDLEKAGYLHCDIPNGQNGPCGGYSNIRISINGRDYLERVKQKVLWRRMLGGILVFLVGLLSSSFLKWMELLSEYFAKKHGLK